VKHDVNNNRIGIDAIDAGRINDVRPKMRIAGVSPTPEMIYEKPPNEFEQMGPGNSGDPVPKDAASRILGRIVGKTFHVLYALRIKMNLPTRLVGEAFNLFDDTEFRAVAPVEKGRYNRNAQVRPSWPFGTDLPWTLIPPRSRTPSTPSRMLGHPQREGDMY
jgi:hypothetical protein